MSLGPLGEYRLLSDEAVSAVGGALVKDVLRALVTAARLVVMVGNFFVTLRPKEKEEK